MSGKRKKVTVTMEKKLEALFRIDKGEPLKSVAIDLGVGTSTVSDWKKNRKEIEDFCAKMVSRDSLGNRGTIKKAKNVTLDDALYVWYIQERENGVPVSGPILRKKALSLNKKLGGDPTFTASVGWLGRWKARHGIRLTLCSESLLEDAVTNDTSDRLILEDDIVTVCLSTQDEEDIQNSFNDRCHQEATNVNHFEATEMLEKLITYFEQQSDTLDNDLVSLRNLHERVSKKYLLTIKEENTSDFVK
ncbi:PREDICTED: jerky protein homolog-like [Eufriesea mexicana]|uniref:jerky protein homolog-like n=1 Tax=Eufriesea mexicana TaxID=516756 RepID=UPI00083BF104|nr:PREDICTED: jerky protein homolog-like [Eufriesea mexicana]XP_017763088.1 PREDICTED: jerky protein homolog-like [Eufriesea mexicana]